MWLLRIWIPEQSLFFSILDLWAMEIPYSVELTMKQVLLGLELTKDTLPQGEFCTLWFSKTTLYKTQNKKKMLALWEWLR